LTHNFTISAKSGFLLQFVSIEVIASLVEASGWRGDASKALLIALLSALGKMEFILL
jgi:hypothetical protein